MMKAKDTMIKLNRGGILSDIEVEYYNRGAEAQAEHTWDIARRVGFDEGVRKTTEAGLNTLQGLLRDARKAGYDKRDSEFVYNPDYLDFQKGVKTGKEIGIREVVEWGDGVCTEHQIGNQVQRKRECKQCWQAQLKEWEK